MDYQEDLDLARKIFSKLGFDFSWHDLAELLKNEPELIKITQNISTNWNDYWKKSLADLSLKDI